MTGEKRSATCTFCGQPIVGEPPDQSAPCEYCSSVSGGYPHLVNLAGAIAGSGVGYLEGATYPQILLGMAGSLLGRKDDKVCGLAMIVAHLACEVAIEQSLSGSFARKGIESLEEAVGDVLIGYNIANEKVWELYVSLTGDEIREQPFWPGFIEFAKRRDDIVRKGFIAGRKHAVESLKTANELVAYLAR